MKTPSTFKCSAKLKAYTPTEILIVLVIIEILTLWALPNQIPLITKVKKTESKIQLRHAHQLRKTYFYEKSKYRADLPEIGYTRKEGLINTINLMHDHTSDDFLQSLIFDNV